MNTNDTMAKHDIDKMVKRYIYETATPMATFKRRNEQAARFVRRLGNGGIFA